MISRARVGHSLLETYRQGRACDVWLTSSLQRLRAPTEARLFPSYGPRAGVGVALPAEDVLQGGLTSFGDPSG